LFIKAGRMGKFGRLVTGNLIKGQRQRFVTAAICGGVLGLYAVGWAIKGSYSRTFVAILATLIGGHLILGMVGGWLAGKQKNC
jgi:hypothetical protein